MPSVAPSSSLLDTVSKMFFPLTWLQVMLVSEQGFRECAGWTWQVGSQAGRHARTGRAVCFAPCHAVSVSLEGGRTGLVGKERTGRAESTYVYMAPTSCLPGQYQIVGTRPDVLCGAYAFVPSTIVSTQRLQSSLACLVSKPRSTACFFGV